MTGLLVVAVALMAVGVVLGLVSLVEFAEQRRAARFAHALGRSCGQMCQGCRLREFARQARNKIGQNPEPLPLSVLPRWLFGS
ncbi:hypothetical protein ACSNOI_08775 [Actinomadura kijaniata]|uniref:hypothetical protein n=1 Tax=Actinomadura kijaniata TaxID=46161 RepID=UPI003F1CBB3F